MYLQQNLRQNAGKRFLFIAHFYSMLCYDGRDGRLCETAFSTKMGVKANSSIKK